MVAAARHEALRQSCRLRPSRGRSAAVQTVNRDRNAAINIARRGVDLLRAAARPG